MYHVIELIFVILGHSFKKVGSVLYDIFAHGRRTQNFNSDYITQYLPTWVEYRLCINFTIVKVHVCAPNRVTDIILY